MMHDDMPLPGTSDAIRRPLSAVAFITLLVLTMAQLGTMSSIQFFDNSVSDPTVVPPPTRRLAVVNFVDSQPATLWGVYSINSQLKRFNMTPSAKHVVLVASDMPPSFKALLAEWIGPENVREIDKTSIRRKLAPGLWPHVFSKLEAFNLTEFDKIILLDNDILIRQSIMHWFDLPAPAATPSRGSMEWNSGAMVIEPSAQLYKTLLDYLPKSRAWKPGQKYAQDPWNSGRGHQGFLSSFFLSNVTTHTITTMNYACSILSSDLDRDPANRYFLKYRPQFIETIHFTVDKPWVRATAREGHSSPICAMLNEWLRSVSGADAPRDKLRKLPSRFC